MAGAAVANNAGNRLWPRPRDDATIGIRFDWGVKSKDPDQEGVYWRSFDLQINSNAANPTLKSAASGSRAHVKRVTVLIQVDESGTPLMTQDQFWDQFTREVVEVITQGGL